MTDRKMEQAAIDRFNEAMRGEAALLLLDFHSFPLCGQDEDAGADYLLSDAHRFALVEFKADKVSIKKEGRKPRRAILCDELSQDVQMREFHDCCHYISFKDSLGYMSTSVYRNEVCIPGMFEGKDGLSWCKPSGLQPMRTSDFASKFFATDSKFSLSLGDFETYLEWVMKKTSDADSSTLNLVVYDTQERDLRLIQMQSVAEAYQWMAGCRRPDPPSPSASYSPSP